MNEAFKWYLTAADNGHVSFMFEVGKMFADGKGTERDDKKAFHWFERAAENGSVPLWPSWALCIIKARAF